MDNSTTSGSDSATSRSGQSAGQFAASLIAGIVLFAVQVLVFLLIKDRFARIYQPRTYLVPERERTKAVAPGWWTWIKPVLSTSNSEFVQKCGLDAYFFLRYLRMLLKIFVPAALVILPILLPLNAVGGKGPAWALEVAQTSPGQNVSNITGLDQLAWGNVRPSHTSRYWAHWILALLLIIWVCYVAFDELKNYIRMRQAYITSPQHRLRASATTVLVSAIPEKWLTVEALDGLFDVFPGGIRNIWINRNFDELSEKISRRDKLASTLESAETDLIKKCFKKNQVENLREEKAAGKKRSKEEKKRQSAMLDAKGQEQAQSEGLDSGNPHQIKHTIRDVLDEDAADHKSVSSDDQRDSSKRPRRIGDVPIIGDGLQTIGHGFNQVGRGIIGGIRGANKRVNDELNTTNGFVAPSQEPDADLHPTTAFNEPMTSGAAREGQGPGAHDASPRSLAFDGASEQTQTANQHENDQLPLTRDENDLKERNHKTKNAENEEAVEYPEAFQEAFKGDAEDAAWRRYLSEKDRDTMRLPIFGWQWMPSLPLIGQKVDTIYYCREQVARLNVEIEDDQAHPERFPLMSSAFVQFNHQVAAHMACQSVSHHLPKHMAPRIVEIDPNDVIWDNMSIPWWQTYIRTAGVVTVVIGMIILWAIPVAFTSALSQLSTAAARYTFLTPVLKAPDEVLAILQGVLPPALLALLMFLLPVTLRFLSRLQGMQSGVLVELSVQKYYFFFLFVQIFLVVTVASSVFVFLSYFTSAQQVARIPELLGSTIPKASNYFFSYILLQAFSVSAGALVQVGGLIGWFILAPLFDSTARSKFRRQTQLSDIQWGTFFPVYTNLACIGLIYAVVSPLILAFNIITFALFWFVYRYQTLYVTRFTLDTGGLLFPNAINTTFVGLYVMEVALIGLFFLVRDDDDRVACFGQAIGMIVILILTAAYQFLLNEAFRPLFTYLPITLEDDAVRRDEEFARAMRSKHGLLSEDEHEGDEIEDRLEQEERNSLEQDRHAHDYEMQEIANGKKRRSGVRQPSQYNEKNIDLQNPEVFMDIDRENKSLAFMRKTANRTADVTLHKLPGTLGIPGSNRPRSSWADRAHARNRRSSAFNSSQSPDNVRGEEDHAHRASSSGGSRHRSPDRRVLYKINNFNPVAGGTKDLEAQQKARGELADALFAGLSDELEDLTPEERDTLVQRAFQHAALRSRRPVIWIPRDDLGVSDAEVTRMAKFSKHIWVSNVRQGLDSKGRAVYSGVPPDFSELDLIRL